MKNTAIDWIYSGYCKAALGKDTNIKVQYDCKKRTNQYGVLYFCCVGIYAVILQWFICKTLAAFNPWWVAVNAIV